MRSFCLLFMSQPSSPSDSTFFQVVKSAQGQAEQRAHTRTLQGPVTGAREPAGLSFSWRVPSVGRSVRDWRGDRRWSAEIADVGHASVALTPERLTRLNRWFDGALLTTSLRWAIAEEEEVKKKKQLCGLRRMFCPLFLGFEIYIFLEKMLGFFFLFCRKKQLNSTIQHDHCKNKYINSGRLKMCHFLRPGWQISQIYTT